ncbi:MAG: FAD-dependent oxidoreductase [Mangrovibacterium sp.]
MKYLVIGGVAGGATVSARLRRLDEQAEIIIFEKGEHISYANCGLPYYIGDVIKNRGNLLLQTPESFKARFNIDVRVFNEVVSINAAEKEVAVKNSITGESYTESYDKLILSPGASPVIPPIPGIQHPKIMTLRNVADTDRVKEQVTNGKAKTAIVVGAGFIGLEMAENLHQLGMSVSVVEAGNQVMNPIDYDLAIELHEQFKQQGVGLYLGQAVKKFTELPSEEIQVELQDGTELAADVVIFSIGVKADSALAKTAGVETNERGMILVNEHLETSVPDIYALGDAVLSTNRLTGKMQPFFLAGPANKQARILANYLVKNKEAKFKGAIGTAIAKVFDLTAAVTGLSEKAAQQAGIEHLSSTIRIGSHAGYYPGAAQMLLKIVFTPDGEVLGAQAVGAKGVDKRIDMIATAIGLSATIYDLQEIEQAYAPPYSSAKDPVNQVAFNAENIMDGLVKVINLDEMKNRAAEVFVLDVRTPQEFQLGAIEGAVNIPVDEIRTRISEIPTDKTIYLYCKAGMRGYVASRMLMQLGVSEVFNLQGGYDSYKLYIKNQENHMAQAQKKSLMSKSIVVNKTLNACGMQCPGPIIKLKEATSGMLEGEVLEVKASDAGFYNDVASWCHMTKNELLGVEKKDGVIVAQIRKGGTIAPISEENCCSSTDKDKTIVVFSDDLDKMLASFVIANGAASMGKKVTMFFTFWGLNALKKTNKPKVKKDFMGRMFSMMMASSSKKLNLSKMSFGGLGKYMMRKRMHALHVDSLESMMAQAQAAGVTFIACQMSMDVMGVSAEELIEGVQIGGVANYLEKAETANHNLFI